MSVNNGPTRKLIIKTERGAAKSPHSPGQSHLYSQKAENMGPCGADAFPVSSAGHVLGQERYCPGFYWGWWEWVAWGLSPQITMEHSSLGPLQTTWGQPCAWHATPPAPWIFMHSKQQRQRIISGTLAPSPMDRPRWMPASAVGVLGRASPDRTSSRAPPPWVTGR